MTLRKTGRDDKIELYMGLSVSTPDKRLFHIGRECYILYVGTDPRDEKPFIRIGAGSGLPPAVLPETGIVVTSPSFTGNPCRERENLDVRRPEVSRYIGDGDAVVSYRRFLELLRLSAVHVQNFTELGTGAHRSIVTFFDDGNFTVSCNGGILFDLARRERRDHHFIRISEDLSYRLSLYPYRYSDSVLNRNGLFFAGSGVFLTNGEGITAYGLPDDFFVDLSLYGIDPDMIVGVVTETIGDEVVNWLKRTRTGGRRRFLQSRDIDTADGLSKLFSIPDLEIKPWNSESSGGALSEDCRFRFGPDGFELITRAFKGKNSLKFLVSDRGAELRIGESLFFIPSGIPILVEAVDIEREPRFNRFIASPLRIFRESLDPGAYAFCEKLAAACRNEGTEFPEHMPERFTAGTNILQYFLQNCFAFCLFESIHADGPGKEYYSGLCVELSVHRPAAVENFLHLPVYGILDIGSGIPFFAAELEAYVQARHDGHRNVVETERNFLSGQQPFFLSERERLQDFIRELEVERRRPKKSVPVRPEASPASAVQSVRSSAVPESVAKPGERLSWETIKPAAHSDPVIRKQAGKAPAFHPDFRRILKAAVPAAAIFLVFSGGYLLWTRIRNSFRETEPDFKPEPINVIRDEPLLQETSVPGTLPAEGAGLSPTVASLPSEMEPAVPDDIPASAPYDPGEEYQVDSTAGMNPGPVPAKAAGHDFTGTAQNGSAAPGMAPAVAGDGKNGPASPTDVSVPDSGTRPGENRGTMKPLVLAVPAQDPAVDFPPTASPEERPVKLPVTSPAPSLKPERETTDENPAVSSVPAVTGNSADKNDSGRAVEIFTGSFGSVTITENDLLSLENRIIVMNREILPSGSNPGVRETDLVLPGVPLKLPDGKVHDVLEGDTLRSIALEAIRGNIVQRSEEYARLRQNGGGTDVLFTIELIRQKSWCEGFIRLMDSYRKTLGKYE